MNVDAHRLRRLRRAGSAKRAQSLLAKRYGNASPDDADVIVALGGDGLMLQTLHRFVPPARRSTA